MKISNISIIIVLALFALVYMIYQNVLMPITERSYITTTYFYVFIALLLIVLINDLNFITFGADIKFFALALLIFALIFALKSVSAENQLMKHLIWIAFVGAMALLLSPLIDSAKSQNILNKVLITVGVMFITMTYFAHTQSLDFLDSWQPYLYSGLIALVVAGLANIIFSDIGSSGFNTRDLVISAFAILLFNGFLFFDTQKIRKDAKLLSYNCAGKDHMVCADYPDKSLNIFLDIINLFTSTTSVYGN